MYSTRRILLGLLICARSYSHCNKIYLYLIIIQNWSAFLMSRIITSLLYSIRRLQRYHEFLSGSDCSLANQICGQALGGNSVPLFSSKFNMSKSSEPTVDTEVDFHSWYWEFYHDWWRKRICCEYLRGFPIADHFMRKGLISNIMSNNHAWSNVEWNPESQNGQLGVWKARGGTDRCYCDYNCFLHHIFSHAQGTKRRFCYSGSPGPFFVYAKNVVAYADKVIL